MIALAVTDIGPCDVSSTPISRGLTPQPLWTPHYPGKVSLILRPDPPKYQTFNPILNINFGGTDGERLHHLTRIVAHMEDPNSAFVGFAFEFNWGTSLFGRQGRTEVSFLIDAFGGERISEFTYEQASTTYGISSLHVT